jgi:hypothetical protein
MVLLSALYGKFHASDVKSAHIIFRESHIVPFAISLFCELQPIMR